MDPIHGTPTPGHADPHPHPRARWLNTQEAGSLTRLRRATDRWADTLTIGLTDTGLEVRDRYGVVVDTVAVPTHRDDVP